MIIKEIFSRDYIDSCIADMEAIGYEYNGTDNRGRLVFDSVDGNSSLAFPDWDEVKKYLDSSDFPELYKFESCMKEDTDEYTPDAILENIDYIMYKSLPRLHIEVISDNTFGKFEVAFDDKIVCNHAIVTVEFDISPDRTACYIYYINNEGPYETNDDERVCVSIRNYLNEVSFEDEDDLDESCIKEEDSSKADDIDFIMNKYVDNKPVSGSYGSYDKIEIKDNKGKGKYTVSCNGYSVDIDFDLDDDSAQYVYYIEGEGPYAHNSYEYITKDIAHYIDWAVKHYGEDDDLDESQCLTEASLPDWQDTIMIEIRNILENNRIYADIYDDYDFDGDNDAFVVCVQIENGDWKHEHKRADILITDTVNQYDNMEITKIGEETIGDSEDDTYSSIHKFHIIRYPDDNGFDFDNDKQLDIKFPTKESIKHKNKKSIKEANDSPYEWQRHLPNDVYKRLLACKTRKEDIVILATAYYNYKLKNKGGNWTPEDALISIWEWTDSNGQDIDLTKNEYDDILYDINKLCGFRESLKLKNRKRVNESVNEYKITYICQDSPNEECVINIQANTAEDAIQELNSCYDESVDIIDIDEITESMVESIDLNDYKFKFSTKDGYKIYSKFDKTLNKGLWVAQRDEEEPFEITYEQARGFEPINPTERKVQHMVKKALKMESKTIKEDIEDLSEYIGCEATFDGDIDDIKSYFTKKEFKEIKEYIGSDCDIVDLDGPNDSYAVIKFSDGAKFTVPFDFLEVHD